MSDQTILEARSLGDVVSGYLSDDHEAYDALQALVALAEQPMGEDVRKLLVEADAFISHMLYRGSWPGERRDVEQLIGRFRKTGEGQSR